MAEYLPDKRRAVVRVPAGRNGAVPARGGPNSRCGFIWMQTAGDR